MGCCVGIPQDKVGIIEKFGKFEKIAEPGCLCLPIPGVWTVSGTLSTRVRQINVDVETKTQDNVFVQVTVAVQFVVLDDPKCKYDAFYKLASPVHQIQAYVEDVVRASVPGIDLDNVFLEKQHIAESIHASLEQEMRSFGYQILATLVTDIKPDSRVKYEMNEINASRRMRIANTEKAEAAKFTQIKSAEANAEAAYLTGRGAARQREAIIEGMKSSMGTLADDIRDVNKKDVMELMLVTQYFDTLKDITKGNRTKVIFFPRSDKQQG